MGDFANNAHSRIFKNVVKKLVSEVFEKSYFWRNYHITNSGNSSSYREFFNDFLKAIFIKIDSTFCITCNKSLTASG